MPRIAVILETEEESGSPNLITLLKKASDSIGNPDIMYCMDSGAFDYEKLWITSSLRGIVIIDCWVECGAAGYHSGEVGGIVPETFRIVRTLLDRLDDKETGEVCAELQCEVPAWKSVEAKELAELAGPGMHNKYAVVDGVKYCSQDNLEKLYLKSTWEANLSVTGCDGLPGIAMAGNVIRPKTGVRISMRLPPTMDPKKAQAIMEEKLTKDVPYNAKVTLGGGHAGSGWCMKDIQPWLMDSIKKAGEDFYGKPTGTYAIGGSIPFLSELEKMYPKTEIIALGVLGPNANAHGPNEMINLTFTKKLTCALSHMLADSA